ncbi:YIEGIA family protein [Halanaerobacter jeridensis]|uniref:Membrane protein YeaQ/YmgE (Transglycosylase-associated protein family) n=1 Tax=Halanaerobacter jeridensis TaxID=706427 RepID=A0A938XTH7_9FIRM|nr:YIEGIA family protein [Halanaerobacter jeridensis]MBM7556016.1 putative membrane protein YeaQ/YmgE (transglycosylase-associated protein family) [Halanaerobacter jeridensis]
MKHWQMIIAAVVVGTCARLIMLKIDYRQYPGYPHGYIIHLTLGFIAAALGGLVIPALIEESYVAVTFLALAAQQFRAVREAERDFLQELEKTELVKRGQAYIEGISKVFEARNYLAMITSFITTLGYYVFDLLDYALVFRLVGALSSGILVAYLLHILMSEKTIGDIAEVEVVELEFCGPENKNIAVENVVIMNLGLNESLEKWKKYGLGIVIAPKDDNSRATLANVGQRQAIIHDVTTQLGVQLDLGVQDYTPLARLNLNTGRVYIIVIPIEKDASCIKEAVNNTPVLEGVKRRPLASKVGQEAAD